MTLIVILTGVRSGSFGNLRSATPASPRLPDDKILVDDDAKRPAGADAQGRLNIEIAGNELIASPRSVLLRGFANRAHKVAFAIAQRSEERRGGKECVGTVRAGW